MQLTKRLAEAEKNLQRARSEVLRLKLKIEEMVTNENALSNASPIYTVPPTRVVENLKFIVEKKEVVGQPEKPLKERVVLQIQPDQNVVVDSSQTNDRSRSEEAEESSITVINIILHLRSSFPHESFCHQLDTSSNGTKLDVGLRRR